MAVAYQVKIGGQTASSKPSANERQLLSLSVRLDMSGAGGCCEMRLGDPENALPQIDERVTVDLDVGAGSRRVFTGLVDAARTDATGQTVIAYDGLRRLASLEVDAAYEDVSVDFVVKDLLGRGNAEVGQVAEGFKLAALRVNAGSSALHHILQLADWCGADVFTDGEGRVHFTTPAEQGSEHGFQFNQNVMRIELQRMAPVNDGVEVFGEGAASSQGADKFFWLPKDLTGVSGKASIDDEGKVSATSGTRVRRLVLGAVRSGEAAGRVAEARLKALAARRVRGFVDVVGEPGILPGDRVRIDAIPERHGLGSLLEGCSPLRVRGVFHQLSRRRGFITRLEF